MDEETPYIPHDGGRCPVAFETLVDIKTRGSKFNSPREHKRGRAHFWVWEHCGNDRDIVAYRISQ